MASTINATPTSSGLISTADNSGVLALQTGGTTAVTIDTSQNASFAGAITPAVTGVRALGSTSSKWSSVYTSEVADGTDQLIGSSGTTFRVGAGSSWATQAFYTGGTERMRIDSSGNLLLNATSTIDTSMFASNIKAGYNFATIKAPDTGSYMAWQFQNNSGTRVGYIQFSTTATTFSTSSDYRLKENIAPMTGALDVVLALKPVTYKWKVNGSDGQGFIAHELQSVVPDCVVGSKDEVDAQGNPIYQGIDTSFLVATLTAAIQELKAQVDAQALEIQALKGVA